MEFLGKSLYRFNFEICWCLLIKADAVRFESLLIFTSDILMLDMGVYDRKISLESIKMESKK